MLNKSTLLFVLLFISIQLFSQINFIDKSNSILNNAKIYTGLGIAVADINSDYYDDIVVLDKGIYLKSYINSGDLSNFKPDSIGKTFEKAAWTINTGDLDNDGIAEIYTCGAQTYGHVYKLKSGRYQISNYLLGVSYAQNSNIVDINNDGFLDLFVCNENNYNAIYINDKTGNLIWNDYINFKVDSNYNNYGDYGSDFIDFDDDGDVDLFITKCWAGADEPDDPRRVNTLFVNDGDNNYSDKANQYGLNSGAQSWTGMFGDMDNDGDLDCFVTNHDTFHFYYENINNDTFINQTPAKFPEVYCNSIQASLRDFDNNGYLDILISGDKSFIIWNKGSNQYTVEEKPFGRGDIHSFAIGDFNDDGFLDIYTSYGEGLNQYSNYKDLIWINNKNNNHWAKFSLLGQESNRQGIGSKIKIFVGDKIQIRDARIGESYGITNSVNLNFGLGSKNIIDSLTIKWPSGITDKYYKIEADNHYLLQEGIGMTRFFEITTTGFTKFCSGDSVILHAPEGNDLTYKWSTNETTKDIIVKKSGTFSVTVTNPWGQKSISKLIKTELNPNEKPETSFLQGYIANCPEDTVILQCDNIFSDYLWSDGQSDRIIKITKPGFYSVKVQGTCDILYSDTLKIDFLDIKEPYIIYTDTIHKKQRDTLIAEGDSILWYSDEFAAKEIFTGNIFITDTIDRDTSFWLENHKSYSFESKYAGIKNNIVKTYGSPNTNGGLIFDCLKDVILKSVKVYSGKEGIRRFQIKNKLDSILFYKDIFLSEGEQRVNLYFLIAKGENYKLETDKNINLQNMQSKSPKLTRDVNNNVQFPYNNELISIKTSYFGRNYYYYFYDWEVAENNLECHSDRIEIPIVYNPKTGINTIDYSQSIDIFPNPADDYIMIKNNISSKKDIFIYNSLGKLIFKSVSYNRLTKTNISQLKQGIYFVIIKTGNNTYTGKFIKE